MAYFEKKGSLLTKEQERSITTALKRYRLNENVPMKKCIDEAICFFINSPIHIKLFNEVLTIPKPNLIRFCMDNFISTPQMYLYRKEIYWRIAMMCYAIGIFTLYDSVQLVVTEEIEKNV